MLNGNSRPTSPALRMGSIQVAGGHLSSPRGGFRPHRPGTRSPGAKRRIPQRSSEETAIQYGVDGAGGRLRPPSATAGPEFDTLGWSYYLRSSGLSLP